MKWLKDHWIITLTIGWLAAGSILLIIYLVLFKAANWQVLTGFATWVLAGGVGAAIWQIRQARKSTNAQVAMDLFRELRSDRALGILRYIYGLPPRMDRKSLLPVHNKNIEYVLNRLGILGILVDEDIIDRSLAVEGYSGAAVLRCWYQLFSYIKDLRDERGDYIDNYEGFVRLCLEHFKKEHIKVKFKNDYDNVKNLVTKLQEKEFLPRSLNDIRKQRKEEWKKAQKEAKKRRRR
jgi:hypothetical protein